MRQKLNLSSTTLGKATFLIHGNYGTGKTFFMGDMLKEEGKVGPVRYINIKGEDGSASVQGLGLEELNNTYPNEIPARFYAETVENLADFKEAVGEYKKIKNLRAVGIDGGQHLYRLIMRDVAGDRLPEVGGNRNEWGEIHFKGINLFTELHYLAPIVVVTSSSDKSVDQIRGETHLTPDMPGRMAAGIAGLFDCVFVLNARVLGPGRIQRILLTAPVEKVVVRYRLPRPLPDTIELPDGPGGWKKVWDAINATYKEIK